jgi:cadmium resistance protein CadD (predicted permease)
LFIASLTSSLLGLVIPHTYLGLLGIAPVLIGLKKLWDLRQPPGETDHAPGHAGISLFKQAAGVAMVTIANGGDNLGVYIPFLAVRSKVEIIWIALVFLVMTGAWCGMAYAMVRHPRVGAPIQRYGHIIAPVVLIVLGLVILYQAGSFGLLSHHLH